MLNPPAKKVLATALVVMLAVVQIVAVNPIPSARPERAGRPLERWWPAATNDLRARSNCDGPALKHSHSDFTTISGPIDILPVKVETLGAPDVTEFCKDAASQPHLSSCA